MAKEIFDLSYSNPSGCFTIIGINSLEWNENECSMDYGNIEMAKVTIALMFQWFYKNNLNAQREAL